ncbi:MAG: DUF4184 family protein [Pseudomonadota bacterium]
MPFTLCHPAIVLPRHRYARSVTSLPALVIGSMAPDFVYFFSFGVSGSFSHSGLGIVLYCVPAGAAVYLLYYAVIRQPFLAWLPSAISARMAWNAGWPLHDAQAVWTMLVSLAIGAATHISWDAFTHDDTAVVRHFGVLRSLIHVGHSELPVFKVLQHLSTFGGFIVIATVMLVWFSRNKSTAPFPRPLSAALRLCACVAVSVAGIVGGVSGLLSQPGTSAEHGLFNAVVTGMATATLAIVFLCLAWKILVLRKAKNR